MGLYGYPKNQMLITAGFLTHHGDDRIHFALSEKHRILMEKLWNDLDLCKEVADLLMESADVNHYYLGHRLLKISERKDK